MHPGTTGALLTSIANIPPVELGTAIFVFGHIISLAPLAVALWRGHAVPAWAAILLGLSQVLHFVFAVITPIHLLDGCAWGLTAGGVRRRGGRAHPRAGPVRGRNNFRVIAGTALGHLAIDAPSLSGRTQK